MSRVSESVGVAELHAMSTCIGDLDQVAQSAQHDDARIPLWPSAMLRSASASEVESRSDQKESRMYRRFTEFLLC